MITRDNTPTTLSDYRLAVKRLEGAREQAIKNQEVAEGQGDLEAMRKNSAYLRDEIDAFKELRASLTPHERLIAEFNIQVTGPRTVTFVLPRGASRIGFMKRAEALAHEVIGMPFVHLEQMKLWEREMDFVAKVDRSTRITVIGGLPETLGYTLREQKTILASRGLELPSVADLATAHVAYNLLIRGDMFRGFHSVRAIGCQLCILETRRLGMLCVLNEGAEDACADVAAAGRPLE